MACGFFEGLAQGLLPGDLHAKRAASRVLLQYAQLARGEPGVSERLAQDLAFFCAQAVPASPAQAPRLAAVRQAWGLQQHVPVDYEQVRYGRFDPALLAQVRKAPKSFAEVARKNSQDPGSAAKGGDLDFFARGAMVKPFEDAVFGMKEGEISDLVESDFGFHIIQLTGIKSPKAPSFEAMRPQLEADLRKQQAQRKFAELAETFSNSVYEQADALAPVADKLKLSLKQAKGVTRMPTGGVSAELANPKVLQALFSDDAVGKRRNTEAIEVATNTLVSARIAKHYPSVVRPFAEVRDSVRQQFVQSRALELARVEGQARLAAWKAQPDTASLGQPVVISRDQLQAQDQTLVDAALRADPAKLPALLGVELGAEGYAVVRVNKIVPREAQSPEQAQQARQQFAQLWAQTEVQAYLAALRKELKVEIVASAAKSAAPSEKP